MDSDVLRRCPFCGGPAAVLMAPTLSGSLRRYIIACDAPLGCPVNPRTKSVKLKRDAIANWNKRVEGEK